MATQLPAGLMRDLLIDGIIAGVGNVVVFVPQIAMLFLFVALLEDVGYLARVAFVIDRLMGRVGLHGKAFVPMLSGFACAVPAVMATRTIESRRDRLITMLTLPLISCSARLPVYALVTAVVFSTDVWLLGVLSVGATMLFAMYALSVVADTRRRGRLASYGAARSSVAAGPRVASVPGAAVAKRADRDLATGEPIPRRCWHDHLGHDHRAVGGAVVSEECGDRQPAC